MSAGYVLPLRPAPNADESLLGYLQRLANENSCERVHWITELVSIEPRQASVGQADLLPLAEMCMVDGEVLDRMRYRVLDEGYVSFRGHRLPREFIRNRFQRVCGPCLTEAPYHRAVWDLAFVVACPEHQVELIGPCRHCGEHLRWNRPSLTHCDCGAQLTTQSGEAVTVEDAEVIRSLLDRFEHLGRYPADPRDPVDLDPARFLSLILFLGRNSLYAQTAIPQQGRTLDRPDVLQLLRSGMDVTQHWPLRFHALLDRCRDQQKQGPKVVSLAAQFGPIFRTITRLPPEGWGAIVRNAFRGYLEANPHIPLGGSSAAIVADMNVSRVYVSSTEVAAILGISPRALLQMMKSEELCIWSTGQGRYRRYSREDIEGLARKLADVINLKMLGRRLGIPTNSVLRRIANSGIFRVLEQVPFGDKRNVYVAVSDVDVLFDRLDAAAERGNADSNVVGFRSVLRCCSEHGINLPALLVMLKQGEIEPVGFAPEGEGLYGYLFDIEKLTSTLAAMTEASSGTVSALTAARRLTVHTSVIYDLVRFGLLQAHETNRRGPKGLRIPIKGMNEFREQFITGPGISRELGVDPKIVNRLVRDSGLLQKAVAVCGYKKISIYRRAAVDFDQLKALAISQ